MSLFGISIAQWFLIIAGVALVVVPYLGQFIAMLNKTTLQNNNAQSSTESNTLTSIVSKWESLESACKTANLEEARLKLNDVFPLLIKPATKTNTNP